MTAVGVGLATGAGPFVVGRSGQPVVTLGGDSCVVGRNREEDVDENVGGGGNVVVNVVSGTLSVVESGTAVPWLRAYAIRILEIRKAAASGTRSM